jgi:hypothetical protein
MKSILVVLLVGASFCGFTIGRDTKTEARVTVQLSAEKDTILYPGPIRLKLAVKNNANEVLYIPESFSLVSNLYPNGVDQTEDNGARIRVEIQPVSQWLAIHAENITASQPVNFIKLRKAASAGFSFDIEPHLQRFIKADSPDTLRIALNQSYQIKVRYLNRWKNQKKPQQTFQGEVESNLITIYLKKE